MAHRRLQGSLTIRLSSALDRKLRARAQRQGANPSEMVRSILEEALRDQEEPGSLYQRTRRWIGAVSSTRIPSGRDAEEALREWKPDRRG